MKCPACTRKMTEIKVGSVLLDICQGGCGGIWFDADELTKVNDEHSKIGKIVEISRDEDILVDEQAVRSCPHCARTKLARRLFSLGTGVEMDCCPKCHGIWLDYGELEKIHEETNPDSPRARHVVARSPRSIPINFDTVQQVKNLQISQPGKPNSSRLR